MVAFSIEFLYFVKRFTVISMTLISMSRLMSAYLFVSNYYHSLGDESSVKLKRCTLVSGQESLNRDTGVLARVGAVTGEDARVTGRATSHLCSSAFIRGSIPANELRTYSPAPVVHRRERSRRRAFDPRDGARPIRPF